MSTESLFPEEITIKTAGLSMYGLRKLEDIDPDEIGWPTKRFLDGITRQLRASIADQMPEEPEKIGSILDLNLFSAPLVRIENRSDKHWMHTMNPDTLYSWDEIVGMMLDAQE